MSGKASCLLITKNQMPRRVCEVLIACRLLAVSLLQENTHCLWGLLLVLVRFPRKHLSYSLSHGCRRVTAAALRESNLGFQQSAPLCVLSYFLCLEFCINSINCTLCPRDALLLFTFFILGNKPQEFYGGRKSCIMGQERMASSDLILTQLHPNPLFPFRSSCPSLLPPAPCSSELPGTSIFFILLRILWYYLCGY